MKIEKSPMALDIDNVLAHLTFDGLDALIKDELYALAKKLTLK